MRRPRSLFTAFHPHRGYGNHCCPSRGQISSHGSGLSGFGNNSALSRSGFEYKCSSGPPRRVKPRRLQLPRSGPDGQPIGKLTPRAKNNSKGRFPTALLFAWTTNYGCLAVGNQPDLLTVVPAVPATFSAPGRPPRVIGLRVVRISRLTVLARGIRTIIYGAIGVSELVTRRQGGTVHFAYVMLGRCGRLHCRSGHHRRTENDESYFSHLGLHWLDALSWQPRLALCA